MLHVSAASFSAGKANNLTAADLPPGELSMGADELQLLREKIAKREPVLRK